MHGGLSQISCKDCQKWVVDLKSERFVLRSGKRQVRRPNQPTPCRNCPKGSPEEARLTTLTAAHWKTLSLYVRCRATFGRSLSEEESKDPILLAHFASIDSTWRAFDKTEAARMIADSLPFHKK